MGRKLTYNNDIHPKAAKALVIKGYTYKEIADIFGISAISISKWMEKYPDFYKAIKGGMKEATGEVILSEYKKCIGFYKSDYIYEIERPDLYTKDGKFKKKIKLPKGRPPKPKWICIRKTKKYYPPDQRAIEWWTMNKAKWTNKSDVNNKNEYVVIPPTIPGEKTKDSKNE